MSVEIVELPDACMDDNKISKANLYDWGNMEFFYNATGITENVA